jgi:hypothetical protein
MDKGANRKPGLLDRLRNLGPFGKFAAKVAESVLPYDGVTGSAPVALALT